jgi:17beta-estradiol 17-dehydrogenase / very-long-chain 3-oxoacyl-CoA reductase
VNNVAMGLGSRFFHETPNSRSRFDKLLHCNMTSVVQMTRLVLPQMIQRRKGLIVNISSMTSLIPAPLNSLYAASKAFVVKFSNEIRTEYQGHGIKVQTVILLGFMGTFYEFSWFSDPSRVRFDENEWLLEIFVGCAEPD